MSEARKFAFLAHESARSHKDLKSQFIARACGHVAATAHVKTHAFYVYKYIIKALLLVENINIDTHKLEMFDILKNILEE